MENQEKKNQEQVDFFEMIHKVLPAHLTLVDVVSELLRIGIDASYRRIRGAKLLDFKETMILCRHFGISPDSVFGITDKSQIRCNYRPLDLSDLKNYLIYVQNLAATFERVRSTPDSEMTLSASDIMFFNLLDYKELTFFKLFSWHKGTYGFAGGYDEFVTGLADYETEIVKGYNHIVRNYQSIPSTEIWSDNTIGNILRLLHYHYETGSFSDARTPLFLCGQLLDLVNTMETWTEKGAKGTKDTPFKFYVSETDLEGTFILLKQAGKTNCLIKLFTINSISISDERFCHETEHWLKSSAKRATFICGASEKGRYKFFHGQRQKIRLLMDRMEREMGDRVYE